MADQEVTHAAMNLTGPHRLVQTENHVRPAATIKSLCKPRHFVFVCILCITARSHRQITCVLADFRTKLKAEVKLKGA